MTPQRTTTARLLTASTAVWFVLACASGCVVQRDAYDIEIPVYILDDGAPANTGPYYAALYGMSWSHCDDPDWSYDCQIIDMATGPDPGTPRLQGWVDPVDAECDVRIRVVAWRDDDGNGRPQYGECHDAALSSPYIRDEPVELDLSDRTCTEDLEWCDFAQWDWGDD